MARKESVVKDEKLQEILLDLKYHLELYKVYCFLFLAFHHHNFVSFGERSITTGRILSEP